MGAFDISLGVMLLGTWANMMLYMLEITQVIRCFKNYPRDSSILKGVIWLLLAVDTACTFATCSTVYMYTVTYWGNLNAVAQQYWSFPMYCTTTALSAFIVQLFLIFRFFSLSRNYVWSAGLSVTAIAALVGGLWTSAWLIKFPGLTQRHFVVLPVAVWFSASTATDLLIATSLVFQLRRVKTSFKHTESLLRRLIRTSIQTGSVTSFFALVVLGFFLQNNQGSIAVMFNSCLGRIYALTMLHNLNSRKSTRLAGAVGGVHTTGGISTNVLDPESNQFDLSQIRVEHSTQVTTDRDMQKSIYEGDEVLNANFLDLGKNKTPGEEESYTQKLARVM